MASQHRNKLVRRLPLRCFPVCWRALSIRSAMAFWTEARDEGKRHGGVTRPKSRCIANIGHLLEQRYTAAMVLEGFDASMWSRQLRHSMAFSCVLRSQQLMRRGKATSIDRLINVRPGRGECCVVPISAHALPSVPIGGKQCCGMVASYAQWHM